MIKQKLKLLFTIIFILSYLFCILPTSFATGDAFDFSQYETISGNEQADTIAKNAMGTAINIIRIASTGVAIVMLSYMAIKYIMAAPSEKAEFKKSATIFIVGAILVFAAGNILGIIVNYTQNNIST